MQALCTFCINTTQGLLQSKKPRETNEQVLKLLNHNIGYDHKSIHQWRDIIKLVRSDDVLVAFAWAMMMKLET
jgi:hypothetical protein